MLKVIGSFVVAVLCGWFAEEHSLFVEKDVPATRSYPETKIPFVLGCNQE